MCSISFSPIISDSDALYLIFTEALFLSSAIGEDRGLNGIQRKSLLKRCQIMSLTMTVMILLERLYMMKNISGNVSREGMFPLALPLKEMKNIIGTKIMLTRKKTKKIP